MPNVFLFVLMLFAGIGIPIMAALNSGMGQQLHSPLAAVVVLCVVALASSTLLLFLSNQAFEWDQIVKAPPFYLLAGLFFIFYIASITYTAPKIGLGNAVLMVIFGQLLCAALIDHFGLLEAQHFPMTLRRLVGFGASVIGFWLIVAK